MRSGSMCGTWHRHPMGSIRRWETSGVEINAWVAVAYTYTAIATGVLFLLVLPRLFRPIRERRWKLSDNELMAFGLACVALGICYVRVWYAISRWLESPAWMYQHWSSVAAIFLIGIGATIKIWGLIRGSRGRG